MNRRLLIASSLVALLVLVFLLFWNRPKPESPATNATAVAPLPPVPNPTPLTPPIGTPSYEVPPGGAVDGLSDPRWEWWNRMEKIDPSFEWKMPINFYGRVVDQDDQPVSGAAIRFLWNDTSARGTSKAETTSDASGRFSLLNKKGKALSVKVSKDGYHTLEGSSGVGFEYAAFFEGNYHRPDPMNPVIFRLLKKLDPQPLIARHVSEYLPLGYDGEIYYYNVRTGSLSRQAPASDALKFNFERSQSPQGKPFDWKWKVEVVKGGLLETKEEFAQLAPEEGYVISWEVSHTADAQPFRRSAQVRFFVRLAEDCYARVEILLSHPNLRSEGPNLTVNSFLNPSGSRNLEYDPAKQASAR